MLELCGAFLLFASAFLQRSHQFLAGGALGLGSAHSLGSTFLTGRALMFTPGDALLLPGALLLGPLAFQLCGAFLFLFGSF